MALSRPPERYPDQSWIGWGDPAQAHVLSDTLRGLLTDALGIHESPAGHPNLAELRLPPARLPAAVADELAAVVGEEHALTDPEARVRHTRGKSTPDLLRMRAGDALAAPDIVVLPGSHEQVLAVLEICNERRVAVVPFGGGTSVVGALTPEADRFAGVTALDLRRMNALRSVDADSRLAVLEPGLRGPEAEALLASEGFTIGHFPQSFEYATLGGFAAARSSGQASAGYGRFDELVLGLRVATPAGTLDLGRAPKSAAGPDLRQLILGSEGALGVITSLTVQLRPAPEQRAYEGWRFPSFAAGLATVRALVQDGPRPTVLRLSDEAETALNLAQPSALGSGGLGCLAIIGFEGTVEDVAARQAGVEPLLRGAGAEPSPGAGDAWAESRFRGPYLRDAMLDAGALVETIETVGYWSAIPRLYQAVTAAMRQSLVEQGTPPVILCHVSHVYPTGASLYFTVACAQLPDPVAQWLRAKATASDAILDAGGSISHHHGVGTDHRDWFEREVGSLAIDALRSLKRTLDPVGILNPGILMRDS